MDDVQLRQERGRRLSAIRQRSDLTAEEVVHRLSVATRGKMQYTSAAVYSWEKGRNLLRDKVAKQLAPILGCSAEELLGSPSHTPDELEMIPLGGSISSPALKSSPAPSLRENLELEFTLRTSNSGSVIRRRSWNVHVDVEKSEIVVRSGEGTNSESLKIFRSTGEGREELKGRPDYRDLGALRIPFPPEILSSDEDSPVIFLQQIMEALPLFKNEFLKHDQVLPAATKSTPARKLSKDIQYELADFLNAETAQRLTALWEESSEAGEHLEHYLERVLPNVTDPFQQYLQKSLIQTCLLKNHEQARISIDYLQDLSGNDPCRISDTSYLSGRNRWYLGADQNGLSELPKAIDDLVKSVKYARETSHSVRLGQSYLYLARIGIEQADYRKTIKEKTDCTPVQLIEMTREIGVLHGRPDLEFLAERLHVIRLYNEQQYDACIGRGKKLLEQFRASFAAGIDLSNIESNLAIHIGLALRRRNQPGDQEECEQVYLEAIKTGRNDSHAGNAMFLIGDVYADRMLASLGSASSRQTSPLSENAKKEAEQYRKKAEEWYDKAIEAIKKRGDRKALAKAVYRSIWIRSGEHSGAFPEPTSRQIVSLSHAARQQYINRRLVGTKFNAQVRSIPTKLLEEILSVRHLDINTKDENIRQFQLAQYVDPETVIALPRNLGSSLMVQFFSKDESSDDSLALRGWITLPNYASDIRPQLGDLLQEATREVWSEADWIEFGDSALRCWSALEKIDQIEPIRISSFQRLVVVAADDHLDALLPIEAMVCDEETGSPLLCSISDAVIYAGPWASPLRSARVTVRREDITVYADHSLMSTDELRGKSLSLAEIVKAKTSFGPLPIPKSRTNLNQTAVAVVAHADNKGKLRDQVRSWKFNGVRAVFLMFCGSGSFDLISGPFSDGIAQRIRKDLGPEGIVVSNRLPISAAEAIRLLQALEHNATGDLPVAKIITDYMTERLEEHQNPFSFPWFVI